MTNNNTTTTPSSNTISENDASESNLYTDSVTDLSTYTDCLTDDDLFDINMEDIDLGENGIPVSMVLDDNNDFDIDMIDRQIKKQKINENENFDQDLI